jgi:nucleoside-diphosphate-sugar epimerase
MSPKTKKILLTGATGFLGKIIYDYLRAEGFSVTTLGRGGGNDIQCDLSTEVPKLTSPFDWVIHNAGKAHVVPKNEKQKKEFFEINCQGTRNLLSGLEFIGIPSHFTFISTVSVYGLVTGQNISEDHPLQATDAYGKSKIEAEAIISTWCADRNVVCSVVRPPLIAGKNPPGNLGAMIKGIRKGFYFQIGGSKARKSIVRAEDVAAILPMAGSRGGVFNLTDGAHPSFEEIEKVIMNQVGRKRLFNIPMRIAKMMGWVGDALDAVVPGKAPVTSSKIEKITSTLTFDDRKARTQLGWNPRPVIDAFEL